MSVDDFGVVGSIESVKAELAVFDDHSYQVTHLKVKWLCMKPDNVYAGCTGNAIHFLIPKPTGWYLDFNDSFMVVKLQIIKAADEKPPAAGTVVAFENNIIGTLFRDVSLITENQTKLEGENQNYAYKAYLYTLLNASKSAKAYQLANCGWMRDDGGMYDITEIKEVKDAGGAVTTPYSANSGFINRMKWTDDGSVCEFAGPVFLDTWLQKQYFLDGSDFALAFKPNDPKFCLHAATDADEYKVNVLEAALWIRQVNVSPSVIVGHAQGLRRFNYVCPYNGHKIFTKLIKDGGSIEAIPNLFLGIYPKLIIVGLLDHDAYAGKYTKNPFNFKHFDVSSVGLSVNGNYVPHPPFEPNHEKAWIAREYMALFMSLGKSGILGDDNGILMKDFSKGCCLYCFMLAPDMCMSGHAQPARLSPISLEIRFAKPIANPIMLVAIAVYDTKIEMTRDRLWILDSTQSAN